MLIYSNMENNPNFSFFATYEVTKHFLRMLNAELLDILPITGLEF